MCKPLTILIALMLVGYSYATVIPVEPRLNAAELFFPVGKAGKQISLLELSTISIKDFQALTGRKMNFIDRIGFKIAQKKVRNHINADGTINSKRVEKFLTKHDGASGFNLGGFALGFFLGLIGVLIAYLLEDDYKRNRVKWAWIGCGAALLLSLILVIVFLSTI